MAKMTVGEALVLSRIRREVEYRKRRLRADRLRALREDFTLFCRVARGKVDVIDGEVVAR